jgi:cytochrome c biogenesis protein CcdA
VPAPRLDESAPAQTGEVVGDLQLRLAEALDQLADRQLAFRLQQLEDPKPDRVAESAEVLRDEIDRGGSGRKAERSRRLRHRSHIARDEYQKRSIFAILAGIEAVPLSIAVTAGGLSVLNPCGFPLLPAYLSLYVGAREERLASAGGRLVHGLVTGLVVTGGFLGVFAAVGLPVAYGAGRVSDALPWLGVLLGGALVAIGIATLVGRMPRLALRLPAHRGASRGTAAMALFGAGYGVASLGCTLPIFLAVVGSAASGASTALVFAAYGAGMALVVTALALAAAFLRDGLARRLRAVLPHMSRIAGALLVVAGGYLAYYWYRIGFGPAAELANDPVILFVTRFTARVSTSANGNGWLVLAVAGAVVVAAVGVTWRRASSADGARRGRAPRRLRRQ